MRVRHLIVAVLLLLGVSAQANAALLNCGTASAAADCCDPQRPTQGCPAPGDARLSCDQACSTNIAVVAAATLEHEQQATTPDPSDDSIARATRLRELLARTDPPEPTWRPVEPLAARYPPNPTYLATARLRI